MEEFTVVSAPVDAGMGAQDDLSAMDLEAAEELPAGEERQHGETVEEDAEVDAPAEQSQEESMQVAMGRELRRIRNAERASYDGRIDAIKRQVGPAAEVGMRIIEDIMTSKGVPYEAAATMAAENYIRAAAARDGISPNLARRLFGNPRPVINEEQQQPGFNPAARAEQVRREAAAMDMPAGFDFEAAVRDAEFAQMLLHMPTRYAVELYHAKRSAASMPGMMADRLRARAGMPQPGKTGRSTPPRMDFMSMTDDEILAYDRKFQARR